MATKEQVEFVFENLLKVRDDNFLKEINVTKAGVGAVIKILHESDKPVSAGAISKIMGVSTARVAVLLRKMQAKGLIVKESDCTDARKTLVSLSETGRAISKKMKEEVYAHIDTVIEKVGIEKLTTFLTLSEEIRKVLYETLPPPEEIV